MNQTSSHATFGNLIIGSDSDKQRKGIKSTIVVLIIIGIIILSIVHIGISVVSDYHRLRQPGQTITVHGIQVGDGVLPTRDARVGGSVFSGLILLAISTFWVVPALYKRFSSFIYVYERGITGKSTAKLNFELPYDEVVSAISAADAKNGLTTIKITTVSTSHDVIDINGEAIAVAINKQKSLMSAPA